MRRSLKAFAALPLLTLGLVACGDGGTIVPTARGTVAVRFAAPAGAETGQSSDLVIEGFNGTLTLTDVRIVVDDFELKRQNDIPECSATGQTNVCADLDIGPVIIDLPLSAGATVPADDQVPAGEYEEIEFDVVNLQGSASSLLPQARALAGYEDWPAQASIAATGTFRDAQSGQVRPFTVYFDLAAAVELEFRMTVGASGTSTLTIHVDPVTWLTFQGGVPDLSAFDYESTGTVASFSFSFQAGLETTVDD